MSTKKSIPFEFFRPNEFMYFDVGRLANLEREIKMPITVAMSQMEESIGSVGFILAACRAGLAHHYPAAPGAIEGHIDAYLEQGGSLFDTDFIMSISRALFATGLFGKEIADRAIRNELNAPAEDGSADTAEVKNAETASE